jgi:hypothetical protein
MYAERAHTYDQDVEEKGYVGPAVTVNELIKHVDASKTLHIIDKNEELMMRC